MPTPLTTVPIPAGMVIIVWLVAARNGQRKLFQVQTKVKMETAAMAGRARGKAIRRYAVHQPAPSTSAACSSEIGMPSKNFLKMNTAIGAVFTFVLGLGVFFLTLFSTSSGGGSGIEAAHTLFGSIFGLGAGEARLAAAIALVAVGLTLAIARPLLFASVSPDVAGARGVPTRLLGVGFVMLLGIVAAEATQAVGALLLLGLLAAPAAAAHRLAGNPYAGIALGGLLAVAAMWGGLALGYAIPGLPPSTAIVTLAVGIYYTSTLVA